MRTLRREPLSILFVAMSLALAVSGCAGSGEGTDQAAPGTSEATTGAGDSSNATKVLASIVVSADGSELEMTNGTYTATVGRNITFDGSASTGEDLSYAWAFGDGAVATNATEVHAFAEPGLFDVSLTVSSGNASASAAVTLNVTAGGPAPGALVHTEKKEFTGSLPLGNPNSAMNADIDYRDHTFAIAATAPDGTPAVAKKARIVLDGSGAGAVAMYVYWRNPAGQSIASGTANAPDQTVAYEGDMAPGNYVVRVRLFAGAQASYTVKAEVDYFAT